MRHPLFALATVLLIPLFASANGQRQGPTIPTGAITVPLTQSAAVPSLPASAALPQTPALTPALPGTPAQTADAAQTQSAAPSAQDQAKAAAAPQTGPQTAGTSDEAGKAAADKNFDNNVAPEGAAVEPERAAPSGKAKAKPAAKEPSKRPSTGRRRDPNPPGPNADDGGGPAYPFRSIRALGKMFRSILFRPNTPVEPEIIKAIDASKGPIRIAVYEFKLPGLLDALRRARARGQSVQIVIDYSQVFPQAEEGANYRPFRSREIWALMREGFDVSVLKGLSEFGINHNKFALLGDGDGQDLLVVGSYNWSYTAEHEHYENALFSNDQDRAKAYQQYWDWLRSMAQPLHVKGEDVVETESKVRNYDWPQVVPTLAFEVAETLMFNGIELPTVVFSPNAAPGKSAEDRLVQAIDASKKSIDIAIFALRSTKIAEALARAHNDPKRNVKVRVIMDRSQSESVPFGPYAHYLASQGVELKTLAGPDPDSKFQLAQKTHHKFAIFDGKLVETGSANFTKYASKANFENSNYLDNERDVESFVWIYERMFKRAKAFTAPANAPAMPTDADLENEIKKPARPVPPAQPPLEPINAQPRKISFRGKIFPSFAFRPDVKIEPRIIDALNSATKSIRIAAYEFNLEDVMAALRAAKKRGVKIEFVIDHSHVYTRGMDHTGKPRMPSAQIQELINEGFDVLTLKGEKSGIMHNKYLLIDADLPESLVMFGSYNFALTAERNHYENVMFSTERYDVDDYKAYFQYKRDLASPIDREKLDAVLNRTNDALFELEDADEQARAEAAADTDERESKFPPPPVSKGPKWQFNGETFDHRYFSPQGGILGAWLRGIKAAEKSVEMAMFSFYSRELADALVAKAEEFKKEGNGGVVRVVLDAGQSALAKFEGVSVQTWFAERGVEVRIKAGPNDTGDPMFEKQHNKFLLLDHKLLMTGSWNASDTAENNSFENTNLTMDPFDVAGYVEYFTVRLFDTGWLPRSWAPAPKPEGVATTAAGTETHPGF